MKKIALFTIAALCSGVSLANDKNTSQNSVVNAEPKSPSVANISQQRKDKAAIHKARKAQSKALADENILLVASFWTDDITIRRALGSAITGKAEAITAITPQGDPATRILFQRKAVDIRVSSNWPLAYEDGTWTGQVGGVHGPVVIKGRYGAQWVKRNGNWFIRSEVFVALTCDGIGCTFKALP